MTVVVLRVFQHSMLEGSQLAAVVAVEAGLGIGELMLLGLLERPTLLQVRAWLWPMEPTIPIAQLRVLLMDQSWHKNP